MDRIRTNLTNVRRQQTEVTNLINSLQSSYDQARAAITALNEVFTEACSVRGLLGSLTHEGVWRGDTQEKCTSKYNLAQSLFVLNTDRIEDTLVALGTTASQLSRDLEDNQARQATLTQREGQLNRDLNRLLGVR